jgi:Protein of unknown function (DUF3501)
MNPVVRQEILGIAEYESLRGPFRARVIDEKKRRRLSVGPHMTVVFENHDTVLLQIQEMLRTERITREAAVQHEIDTYNELIPGRAELSATLMVEIPDPMERDTFLAAAAGVEEHISLWVDDSVVRAVFDPERVLPDRASAVLYLKFRLPESARLAVCGGKGTVRLVVDHPAYQASSALGTEVLASLAEDLA